MLKVLFFWHILVLTAQGDLVHGEAVVVTVRPDIYEEAIVDVGARAVDPEDEALIARLEQAARLNLRLRAEMLHQQAELESLRAGTRAFQRGCLWVLILVIQFGCFLYFTRP